MPDTSVTLLGALAYPLLDRPSNGRPVCELLIGGEVAGSDGSLFSSFVPVKAFGQLAEDAQRHLRAGTPLIIHGELEMNSYGGRDSTEIIASDIEVLPDLQNMVIWEDVDNTHGRRARLPLEHCMNEIEQRVNLTADPERKSEGLVIARCGWNSWQRPAAPGEEPTKKSHYGELRGIDEVGDALMSFTKGQRLLVRSRAYLRIHAIRGSSRQNRTVQSEVYYVETSVRMRAYGESRQTGAADAPAGQHPVSPEMPASQSVTSDPAAAPLAVSFPATPEVPQNEAHLHTLPAPVEVPTEIPPAMPRPSAHLPSFPLPRGPQQAPSGPAVGQVMTLPPDTEAQPLPAMLRPAFEQTPDDSDGPLTPVDLDTGELGTGDDQEADDFTPDDGHPDLGDYDL